MDGRPLIYEFDDVSVDLEKFEVIKADIRTHLEPKAFEALVFLIEHRGRLVEKKELLDAVWKDAFVGENAMTRVIAQLRKALGDDRKKQSMIWTSGWRGRVVWLLIALGTSDRFTSTNRRF
jgi:DNA-binding winged helix-turn-helix (wHTH) protein